MACSRTRGLLVVSETALAILLLVGVGLLFRSFLLLQRVETGVRPDHLPIANVSLPWAQSTRGSHPPSFNSFTNAAYLAWRQDATTIEDIG